MIMEGFLEMISTLFVAVMLSLAVARVVMVVMADRGCGPRCYGEEKSASAVDEEFTTEELLFRKRMDAARPQSEKRVRFVEDAVESVDLFGEEAAYADEAKESAARSEETGVEFKSIDRFGEEAASVHEAKESATRSEETGAESKELGLEIVEGEPKSVESPEIALQERMIQGGNEPDDLVLARDEHAEVEKSDDEVTAEPDKIRLSEKESTAKSEEKLEELDVEEEDDWEGIERSELEKAFATAAKFVEESGEAKGIGAEAKMELYGLHKVATEGSCREPQPIALMLSARAKWNAWQKLGNMSPEVAMEQYVELLSKEVPEWTEESSAGKSNEIEAPGVLPLHSSSLNLVTTCNSKDLETNEGEGKKNEASRLDNRA